MDKERYELISDLKALKLDYNFSRFSNDQLKIIRDKERVYRFKLCCEINEIAIKLHQEKGHDIEYLYHHGGTKDELKMMKQQGLDILERKKVRQHIEYLATELEMDFNEILTNTIKREPVVLDDFKEIERILEEKLDRKILESYNEPKLNYDRSYALGDDPIMSRIDYEVLIPKEKVKKMISILDSLRKKTSVSYIRLLSKDFYSRITKKFRNLDDNYDSLDSLDFERLISLFNKATEGMDIEPIEELGYRHYL